MKEYQEKFKIRLGLFVLGGLFLFVLAIFIIGKKKHLFDSVFKIRATFYNVSGLQVGNNVRFSGINVGTVDEMRIINDSTIQVEMIIEQKVQRYIKADSKVGIGSEGIIGDRLLIISHGSPTSSTVKNNQKLASSEPIETDAIMRSLKITASNAEIISNEMAEIISNINNGKGTLGRLIEDSTIANNLSKTMQNLKSSSSGLDENMEAAKENFLLRGYFKRKKREEEKKRENRK